MFSRLIHERKSLYLIWFILFIFGVLWSILIPPESAIVYLNDFYRTPLLVFFSLGTRLGELFGFSLAFIVIVLRWRYREMLALVIASLIVVTLSWFFKHMVYPDAIRPSVFLEQVGIELKNHNSYTLNRKFSFPSGHSAAAFTFFFFLALCFKRGWMVFLCLAFALIVALSRVYLAQHFVTDVTAGSLLGVIISSFCYYLFVYRNPWPTSGLNRFVIPK
jgi:membrane-associated phospholipid phosphatase